MKKFTVEFVTKRDTVYDNFIPANDILSSAFAIKFNNNKICKLLTQFTESNYCYLRFKCKRKDLSDNMFTMARGFGFISGVVNISVHRSKRKLLINNKETRR